MLQKVSSFVCSIIVLHITVCASYVSLQFTIVLIRKHIMIIHPLALYAVMLCQGRIQGHIPQVFILYQPIWLTGDLLSTQNCIALYKRTLKSTWNKIMLASRNGSILFLCSLHGVWGEGAMILENTILWNYCFTVMIY